MSTVCVQCCFQVLHDLSSYESKAPSRYYPIPPIIVSVKPEPPPGRTPPPVDTPGPVNPPGPVQPSFTLPGTVREVTGPPGPVQPSFTLPGTVRPVTEPPVPRSRRNRSSPAIRLPLSFWFPYFSGGMNSYEVFEVNLYYLHFKI